MNLTSSDYPFGRASAKGDATVLARGDFQLILTVTVCEGGDADSDGLCGLDDPCPSDDQNDADSDGLCESVDVCPNDFDNDADSDGLCESADSCPNDPNNDADGDGLCVSSDPCPGENPNDMDSDGLCDIGYDPCVLSLNGTSSGE